ncbi:unnamed protein product, partial [Lynx pardinus]
MIRSVLRLLLGSFLTELCARVCRAQERAGHGQLARLGCVKRRLNQSTCTNSDIPLWLNTRKPPGRKDGPLHHPTKDKTNRIRYIMCGVLAVML